MKEPLPERRCLFCDDPFIPKVERQQYDTTDCRYRAARQRKYDERQAEKMTLADHLRLEQPHPAERAG